MASNSMKPPRTPLEKLVEKWREDQISYPHTPEGNYAAAAVRCCANDLEAALASVEPKDTIIYDAGNTA